MLSGGKREAVALATPWARRTNRLRGDIAPELPGISRDV